MVDGRQREGLDYYPCRYGASRLQFRGPAVPLDGTYTVVVGGCAVYGRYLDDPFTDQVAERTGRHVVNLGIPNAGIDVFARDPGIMAVIAGAEAVVVQIMAMQNVSNRCYTVHPRRNDRFLQASSMLTDLYRDVDFSDFSFTRHLLGTLRKMDGERFETVRQELTEAWTARMRTFLSALSGDRILLQVGDGRDRGLGDEPAFVTPEAICALDGSFDRFVRCDDTDMSATDRLSEMNVPPEEHDMAVRMLPASTHRRIADALCDTLHKSGGLAA